LKEIGKIVLVTLHSTIDPPIEILNRKIIELNQALKICDYLFVHSLNDLKNLEEINLIDNVVYLPHGVVPFQKKIANQVSKTFTFATYGFLLPHKGIEIVLEALNLLVKDGVIDIKLILVNSIYDAEISKNIAKNIRQYIIDNNLNDFVDIHFDYLKDEDSLKILSMADVILFPYQQTNESASGAVRRALCSGAIVAVTPLQIFDDVKDIVINIGVFDSIGISKFMLRCIDISKNGKNEWSELNARVNRYIKINSFKNVSNYIKNLIVDLINE
jgi:glycosyltransferase involved in cell wall biosynthesis